MAIRISIPENQELKPRIIVFGIGGAGGNAINNMMLKNLEGAEFIAANTDAQALQQSNAQTKIQLGLKSTFGLGAGARPEVGSDAALETSDQISEIIDGANLCFLTAGMGGGTGTGAAPVVAELARQKGILTVGVVTKPFQFEGSKRMKQAEEGIKQLQKVVDTLIVIPNQNLFRIATEKTTFTEAFSMADDVLYQGVKGVTDLMVKPGLINLDFADVRSVMDEMGKAMMGTGEASGEDRALQAAEKAIANPLLDEISLKGATGLLINVTGSSDMALFEVDEAANRIRDEVDPEANIIVGSTFDSELTGSIRVSVVATGIDINEFSNREENTKTRENTITESSNGNLEKEGYFADSRYKTKVDGTEKQETANVMSGVNSAMEEEKNDEMSFLESNKIKMNEVDDQVDHKTNDHQSTFPSKIDLPEKKNSVAEETNIGGLNNLIRRMTGFKENRRDHAPIEEKNHSIESSRHRDTERDDESKLDIPAFLRRQAN